MGLGQQRLMAECVNMIRGLVAPCTIPPRQCATSHLLMVENANLDRLLTQVNYRITGLVRLRDAGPISERKTEELKQAVELRAELMRQIDWQDSAFDA